MRGESATLSEHQLFDITEDATKLSQTDSYLLNDLWHIYCTNQSERGHIYICQYILYAL